MGGGRGGEEIDVWTLMSANMVTGQSLIEEARFQLTNACQ